MQLTTRTTYTFASDVVAARDYPRWPLGTLVEPGHVMLSEDPYLAVERGERPVVLDGFMFRRIWGARPELAQPLIDRITSGAFDRIVLLVDIETASERSHVFRAHFSPGVWQAIRQHYRLIGTAGSEVRYFVYAPRTGT